MPVRWLIYSASRLLNTQRLPLITHAPVPFTLIDNAPQRESFRFQFFDKIRFSKNLAKIYRITILQCVWWTVSIGFFFCPLTECHWLQPFWAPTLSQFGPIKRALEAIYLQVKVAGTWSIPLFTCNSIPILEIQNVIPLIANVIRNQRGIQLLINLGTTWRSEVGNM